MLRNLPTTWIGPVTAGLVLLGMATCAARTAESDSPPATSAPAARAFLENVNKADGAAAAKLWEPAAATEKLKVRLDAMALKLKALGGIKRVDFRECEARRILAHEKKTGEKIDVVPVEIICGDGSLILAVFSFRPTSDGPRIFRLESLKEWGGTTSLDEDLRYAN